MCRRSLIIALIGVFSFAPASARQINTSGYALVMLGESTGLETGWTNHSTYQELSLNAKSNNMVLLDDKAPAANRKASYIAASGVSVEFTGMTAYKTYTMWIDFVTYSFAKNPGIYSRLQVFADGRQIDEITWGEFDQSSLYAVELPLDLTYDGQVVVTFKEASMQYGNWGVWDIVVASGELPKGTALDIVSPATVTETKAPLAEQQKVPVKEVPSAEVKKAAPTSEKSSVSAAPPSVPKAKSTRGKKTAKVSASKNTVNAPVEPDIRMPEMPEVQTPQIQGPQPPVVPTMPEAKN